MAWEREHHHIDLDRSEHKISLVDKSVLTTDGKPTRYLIHLLLGAPEFEYKVGHNTVRISLGGGLKVQPDGTLKDADGNVFDPRAFEKEMVGRLNAHHTALRAYGRKHNAPELKGSNVAK